MLNRNAQRRGAGTVPRA